METLIQKLVPISFSVVLGLMVTHPSTWRVELAKLQYSILKEAVRTDNWEDPNLIFHQKTRYPTSVGTPM